MSDFSRGQYSGSAAASCFSFGLALAVLSLLAGGLSWWSVGGFAITPSGKWGALAGGLLIIISFCAGGLESPARRFDAAGFAAALLLVFFSDWLCRGYNLLQGPSIRGEIMLFALAAGFLLAKGLSRFIAVLAPLFAAMLIWTFLDEAGGRVIFSDDHATFIYRLALLKDNFPLIPFYYPFWNAGLDARDFFATGALNVFLIFSPLIYSFPVVRIYNLLACGIPFVLTPLCALAAARLAQLSWRASFIAALLSLSPSLLWLRWGLKYGTLGFAVSAALFPLVFSLGCRLIDRDEHPGWVKSVLFLLAFSLMLLWTPAGLAVLPLIGLALLRAPALLRKPGMLKLLAALLALNLPWIFLFWSVSDVSGFIKSEQPAMHAGHSAAPSGGAAAVQTHFKHRVEKADLRKSLQRLRDSSVPAHPLIIVLFIPGIFLLARSHRAGYAAGALWLVILGTAVAALKPQLEFDRMLVLLGLLGCAPAAAAADDLFEQARASLPRFLLAALSGGFLLAAPFSASAVLRNRSVEHFGFASPILEELPRAIREHGGAGRTLFSGFVLHDLSGGHLAPLSLLSARPLIASSPFHNMWRYREVFSREALVGGPEGIRRYLDLFNVSSVITHTRKWRDFFRALPQEYEEVWQGDRFRIFKRKNFESNYFLEGKGEVLEQGSSFVRLRIDTPRALVKFRWFPFLKSPGCAIAGRNVAEETSFIELSGCREGREIRIEAVSPLQRVMERGK